MSLYFTDKELDCRCNECDYTVTQAMVDKADQIREGWGALHPEEPRIDCTSGGRCPNYVLYLQMHGIPAATRSAHISGQAMDLKPRNGLHKEFAAYCQSRLQELDLFMEDPAYTKTWVHLQTRKVAVKSRVFKP